MDRNCRYPVSCVVLLSVALRKESVDRNIMTTWKIEKTVDVALRKESVDRNNAVAVPIERPLRSLSARRAWIEILVLCISCIIVSCRSPQGERG